MNIAALKHASQMASSETSGVAISTFDDIVLSVPPISESNNWVQLGLTAIPFGQTSSSGDQSVLVTGRVTAILVHPDESKSS
jgi:hypothetical protein